MSSSDHGATAHQDEQNGLFGPLARSMARSVKSVMSAMAGLEFRHCNPVLKRRDQNIRDVLGDADFAVSGIIGFSGDGRGSMALRFSRECALGLTARLFGKTVESIDKAVEDTVGEFTNMICGDARRRMSEEGVTLNAGLATVVSGEGHTLNSLTSGFSFVIPFECPQGRMVLEGYFQSSSEDE